VTGDSSGTKLRNSGMENDQAVKVPVNEDYLFDVDVERRELSPAYWLGPVYDVRRGTWFNQGRVKVIVSGGRILIKDHRWRNAETM
jgi:hypothetical protein